MKKFLIVSFVALLYVLCTGYCNFITVFCTQLNGGQMFERFVLARKTPATTLVTPAENIYAHTSGASKLYSSGISPVNMIETGGGGRVIVSRSVR